MDRKAKKLLEERLKKLEQFEREHAEGIGKKIPGATFESLVRILQEQKIIRDLLKEAGND